MKLLQLFGVVSVASLVAFGASQAVARDAVYDSIAVSDARGVAGGDAGYGVGQGDSQADSNEGAMHECKTHHNPNCKLVLTYDMCGAYASSANHAGTGMGRTAVEASKNALDACGHDSCKVVVADCVNH
jgi:hypothetical protein